MSKRKNKPVVDVEEVDVEKLNAEAEDLIGGDDEEISLPTQEEVSEVQETDAGAASDSSESSDVSEGSEPSRELRFLGYDVITKEKVYG